MAAPHSVGPAELAEHLASASPDVLREMVASLANAMMSAQAGQVCGAGYGECRPKRTNHDGQVTTFRQRPLDQGPYTFCWVDALTVKAREAGRVVNVHALVATGVNADGHREILGLDVASAEDGAGGWRSCAGWSPAACPVSSS